MLSTLQGVTAPVPASCKSGRVLGRNGTWQRMPFPEGLSHCPLFASQVLVVHVVSASGVGWCVGLLQVWEVFPGRAHQPACPFVDLQLLAPQGPSRLHSGASCCHTRWQVAGGFPTLPPSHSPPALYQQLTLQLFCSLQSTFYMAFNWTFTMTHLFISRI